VAVDGALILQSWGIVISYTPVALVVRYDPIFYVPAYQVAFAEMTPELKHVTSAIVVKPAKISPQYKF